MNCFFYVNYIILFLYLFLFHYILFIYVMFFPYLNTHTHTTERIKNTFDFIYLFI